MITYRVFIGGWIDGSPDWTIFDKGGLTWEQARDLLAAYLREWKNYNCVLCRDAAMEALARLTAAEPGPFESEIEGDDCLIMVEA